MNAEGGIMKPMEELLDTVTISAADVKAKNEEEANG